MIGVEQPGLVRLSTVRGRPQHVRIRDMPSLSMLTRLSGVPLLSSLIIIIKDI